MTMQLIERVELTSSQASITFSNIPQDGTDLLCVLSVRSSNTSVSGGYDPLLYRINASDTGYSGRQLFGDGSSTGSSSEATRTSDVAGGTWGRLSYFGIDNANMTSNTFTSVNFYLPNYRVSANKSISCEYVNENNSTNGYQELVAHLWSNTAAVTSLSFALGLGSFVSGSSATLYKITKGSDGSTTVS